MSHLGQVLALLQQALHPLNLVKSVPDGELESVVVTQILLQVL